MSQRAHPAISHCSHLLLKCRVATNISHCLKVQSMWLKNYIFAKRYFDQLLGFQILPWLFLHTLLLCHISTLWMLDFFNTIRVSNSLDPYQARQNDLGPNCQQTTEVAPRGQRDKYKTNCWYYLLAKTLARVNFIWPQLFPFGWSVGYKKNSEQG